MPPTGKELAYSLHAQDAVVGPLGSEFLLMVETEQNHLSRFRREQLHGLHKAIGRVPYAGGH